MHKSTKIIGFPKNNIVKFNFAVRSFSSHRQEILDHMYKLNQKIKPDLVLCHSRHDTHQDHQALSKIVYSALRKNNLNVSRATVYRTIDVLYKNNLIRKIELGDSPSKYENKVNSDHHDHIICVQCGRIDEFVDDKIESQQDKIIDKLGFKMIRHIHQLFVLCKDCQ